jgi:dihydrofolate reductase
VIRLIAAIDAKRGIATESGIPWRLPGDTAYFENQTINGLIVMGWATYSEFSAPLHDRNNYVLASGPDRLRTGFEPIAELGDMIRGHPDEDIWVIGGASVFAMTIGQADELFITQILTDFNCTKFFPDYTADFVRFAQSEALTDNGVSYRFEKWRPTD